MSASLLLRKFALKLLHIFCADESDVDRATSPRHLTTTDFEFGTCFNVLCQTQPYTFPSQK
jgi:hypothetical protein